MSKSSYDRVVLEVSRPCAKCRKTLHAKERVRYINGKHYCHTCGLKNNGAVRKWTW